MYGDSSAGQRHRDSRKRRRVSERRRAFSRLGGLNSGESITSSSSTTTAAAYYGASSSAATTAGRRSSRTLKSSFRTMDLDDSSNNNNNKPLNYTRRSDSPSATSTPFNTGDQGKISMKIQFHITPVAQDTEPLILDTSHLVGGAFGGVPSANSGPIREQRSEEAEEGRRASGLADSNGRKKSSESVSIGDHIHERLMSRQNTLSTRRRQQLLALHNQSAMAEDQQASNRQRGRLASLTGAPNHYDGDDKDKDKDNDHDDKDDPLAKLNGGGREAGARSSTISGGMQDEATLRFLAKHQHHNQRRQDTLSGSSLSSRAASLGGGGGAGGGAGGLRSASQERPREYIYFKRDGQRFGHEFTLKLAVDKNYRCLLKVRPLIPLQAISIQGHHVSFVDCSVQPGALVVGSLSSSAPSIVGHSTGAPLASSWQSINTTAPTRYQNGTTALDNKSPASQHLMGNNYNHSTANNVRASQDHHRQSQHHRLSHAQTMAINPSATKQQQQQQQHHVIDHRRVSSAMAGATADTGSPHPQAYSMSLTNSSRQLQLQLLKQQQFNQMMRHFAASHCSPSGSHLGSQLVYMFDWSAARFEVNKNKARTQIQTVLKFKNGEILSLPLQVKFYQPESRQHLNWGSQLHFIDYDCNINNMGQINVDRIQYY